MGNLVFQATLGGQVNLVGPNTASTFNLNVPAVSSTIATTSGTETLTNKTLTSPVISGGTIDNAVIGGTTAAAGSFTTLSASSTLSVTGAGTIQGLTVGKGAGAVASNTAVGASALAANTSGGSNTSLGYYTLNKNTTGDYNTAIGGNNSTPALFNNTTGSYNTAVGSAALQANTTASYNTAVGYQSMYSNTTGDGTALGYRSLYSATNRTANTAIGNQALYSCVTDENTAVGALALRDTTSGSANTAVGVQAGVLNTTGSANTAIGYLALNVNTTGIENTAVGRYALVANTTASYNTAIGRNALVSCTTGTHNTVIGHNSGDTITTGIKNTILGRYNGNQGGLDIRTASNYIVLSDGDGNPRGYFNSSGVFTIGGTNPGGFLVVRGNGGTGAQYNGNASAQFSDATYDTLYISHDSSAYTYLANTGGRIYVKAANNTGVYIASGATSWTSASDERAKDIIEPITDAANKVSTLRAVIGKYKTDEESVRRSFLIAQDVQSVLPEAVDASSEDELGVRYTDVIPLLVAAIKELNAQQAALKAEFDAYKAAHP